jgi:cysteinyl-tRNA synthetase
MGGMSMVLLSDDELHSMLEERELARRSKDWDKADVLREQLRAKAPTSPSAYPLSSH